MCCNRLVLIWMLAASPAIAPACTIPVFRYALEHWESDRFQVIVYHDGPLTPEQSASLDKLDQQSAVHGGPLNIELIRYDVSSPTPPKLLVAERPSPEQPLPLVEVRIRVGGTPAGGAQWARRWLGPLTAATSESGLFDSPARQEIVRRILDGDSAVWLVIAPNAEQGRQASAALQQSLDAAVENIPPPQGIGLPGSELLASVPLEIRFSVLTLTHGDAAETPFLELLSANANHWKTDATYVVPVFGRCRALEVMPYAELDAALTQEIAEFICGACSCQVKQANPGFDLLVAANWEEKLFGTAATAIADSATTTSDSVHGQSRTQNNAPTEPEYVAIPAGEDVPSKIGTESRASGVSKATHNTPLVTSQLLSGENAGTNWSLLSLGALVLVVVVVTIGIRMALSHS
jgi:hypothetical protein